MNQMNSKPRRKLALLYTAMAAALLFCLSHAQSTWSQGGGGGSATGPRFRVLRSVAGSSGTESNGHFTIDDPRTVFYLGKDKKVVVYFEWEGRPGEHKFEGNWKNPEHKIVLVSDFQYVAPSKQFSGYWSILLSGAEPSGMWTLEARIDGESAGELTFQLISDPNAPPPPPPPRQPLTTQQLFRRLAEVSVYVDKIDSRGKAVARGSGFYLADGRLVTAFQNIDGASSLRVISANGTTQEVTAVLSWNRWQDWAILPGGDAKVVGVPRAVPKSWGVGSLCFFLESASGSGRIMADGTIVGQNTFPRAGERLNIVESPTRRTIGSPLVNEYGDVVGVVGGSLAPGADLLASYMLTTSADSAAGATAIRDGLAVPIDLIPEAPNDAQPASLEELTRRGQMVPPVSVENKIVVAGLALSLQKGQGGLPAPSNSRQQFTHQDQKIWAYVNWNENIPFKGTVSMGVYDVDNHALGVASPQKLTLHSGAISYTTWEIPIAMLPSGVYRVDVSQGDEIVWRRFFRLAD
jgi:S1-C subfamily serine protease